MLRGQTKYMQGSHSGRESIFTTSRLRLGIARVAYSIVILGHVDTQPPWLDSCSVTGWSFSAVPVPFQKIQSF